MRRDVPAANLIHGWPGRRLCGLARTASGSQAHRQHDKSPERRTHEPSIVGDMARYTLVYGLRLVPEGTLEGVDEVRLKLRDGDSAGLTLHTIDGTIPQLRRGLDRSLDAFFDFLPGATEEDRQNFDDS